MGIMVYSLLWVMQDFVHQPYVAHQRWKAKESIENLRAEHCSSSALSGTLEQHSGTA